MRQSDNSGRASGSGSIAVAGAQVSSTPSVSRAVSLYHTSRCRTMCKWPRPTTATGPTCNEDFSGGAALSASMIIWHCNCQAVFPISQRRRQKSRGHDRLAPRHPKPCCSWAYLLNLANRPEPCTGPPAMLPFTSQWPPTDRGLFRDRQLNPRRSTHSGRPRTGAVRGPPCPWTHGDT